MAAEAGGIFSFAARYPFQRGWKHLAKGGAIVLLSVLVLPMFILYGYLMRTIRSAAYGEELPPLDGLGTLFVQGLKFFAVFIPYGVVVAAIALIVSQAAEAGSGVRLAAGAVYLLAAYIGPMLVATYAVTGDWRRVYAASTVKQTLSVAYLGRMAGFLVLYIGLYLAVAIVTAVSVITIVGPIILSLLGFFYLLTVSGAYFGRMYGDVVRNQ